MHNLDRGAYEPDESGELEGGELESGEYESGEYESDQTGDYDGVYTAEGGAPESEGILGLLGSILGETGDEPAGPGRPLTEQQETELAAELLELSSEQELEQFFRDLMDGAARAAGSFLRSDTGRALGGVLKDATRQALPIVGRAVGGWVSPGVGGDVGERLGKAAGVAFGLELEGLPGEAQEFEVARAVVRFADAAARQAALTPRVVPAPLTVRRAVVTAAAEHAPGLLAAAVGGAGDRYGTRKRRSGRWIRRGRKLVIFDA
jgi:hypothetical protein